VLLPVRALWDQAQRQDLQPADAGTFASFSAAFVDPLPQLLNSSTHKVQVSFGFRDDRLKDREDLGSFLRMMFA